MLTVDHQDDHTPLRELNCAYCRIRSDHARRKSKSVDGTDGTRIYFTQQSPHFLAQVAIGGRGVTPVTIDLSDAWLGALSLDGSTFLVVSQSRGQEIANSLWTAGVLGGRLRHLADGVNSSAWSPGGLMVMCSTFAGDIDLISSGGTQPRKIATPGGFIESLSWSPDGRTVRFSKDRSRIWEMAADGSICTRCCPTAPNCRLRPAAAMPGTRVSPSFLAAKSG